MGDEGAQVTITRGVQKHARGAKYHFPYTSQFVYIFVLISEIRGERGEVDQLVVRGMLYDSCLCFQTGGDLIEFFVLKKGDKPNFLGLN